MVKVANRSHLRQLVFWLTMITELLLFLSVSSQQIPTRKIVNDATTNTNPHRVRLETSDHDRVVVDNGIFQVTIENPSGHVLGMKYKGFDNVFEARNEHDNRGYYDIVWLGGTERIRTEEFNVIAQTDDMVELSFSRTWNSKRHQLPLNIDKRFIVRRGVPGIYMYVILERQENFPATHMSQFRIVFKLKEDEFRYMALSDTRQRAMPSANDRNRSEPLAFKEAVLLTNPTEPKFKGEVDDKYQYASEHRDDKLHGWIAESDKEHPAVGFWVITPSYEFRAGGPIKQELTSHVGPVALSMFTSTHYVGKDMDTSYEGGKPWKKVYGPVLLYLNSDSSKDVHKALWDDAKRQSRKEIASWPYNFAQSKDFLPAEQRGRVGGQLIVRDRFMKNELMQARSAFVGLASPGEPGSWAIDLKGYQFWTQTDGHGRFDINHVRPGEYNLFAWVHGFIGEYKLELNITIKPGNKIDLGTLIYDPPRNGPTLWEIGIPDRTAAEFFIPDPHPTLMNPLCDDAPNRYRQYGLWDRYSEIYRKGDLVYTVGVSNYSRDWFFAHVLRDASDKTRRRPATWQIKYNLDDVKETGNYTLQLALASATYAEIHVRFNDPNAVGPHFTTTLIGSDNAIARHGIHGLYRLYSITVPGNLFRKGENTIFLTQTRNAGTFTGAMYDYIRLEGPTV